MTPDKLLSIIVPVYNGRPFLGHFSGAIDSQSCDTRSFEIVLVDNGSTDGSFEQLEELCRKHNNWRLLRYTEKQSSYGARNCGIDSSECPFLAFTDIDCRPVSHWIEAGLARLQAGSTDLLLSGPIEIVPWGDAFTPVEWFDRVNFLQAEAAARKGNALTANLMLSRELLNRIGAFKELASGGDIEFTTRAALLGGRLVFDQSLRVLHPARRTEKELKEKLKRVASGIADLRSQALGLFLLKQFIALFIQPILLRMLVPTLKKAKVMGLRWTLAVFSLAIRLNLFLRLRLLVSAAPRVIMSRFGR